MEYLVYQGKIKKRKEKKKSGNAVPLFSQVSNLPVLSGDKEGMSLLSCPPSFISNQSGPRKHLSLLSLVYKCGHCLTLLHDVTYFKQ